MRARILTHALPLLCSGALLTACSTSVLRHPARPEAVAAADDNYLRGRNLHLERRYAEAVAAYQAALRADPGHVNARNGLAIAYAEQRDFDKAIPIWRALTQGATMKSGPGMGFLFANLGYAYFLQGNYEDALVALEKACLLDPLNARAWQYLGEAYQKLGQDERARQMLRQASSLREHDVRADYAAADGGARLPAIERAVHGAADAPLPPDRQWALVEVVSKSNGLLELRRVAAAPAAQAEAKDGLSTTPVPAPSPAPVADAALPPALLEISNGNGRQGVARRMSRQLRDPALKIVRLTNEKGFGVRQTRIEYTAPFRQQAERLAQRIGVGQMVEAKLAGRVDLRLVIGRDLSLEKSTQRLRTVADLQQ